MPSQTFRTLFVVPRFRTERLPGWALVATPRFSRPRWTRTVPAMRLLRRTALASAFCCGLLALTGCPDKTAPGAPDASVAAVPEAPKTPPPTTFALRYQPLADAGTSDLAEISLEPGDKPLIQPTSSLELTASHGLRNYRVRLFDEAERAMVSDDVAEESDDKLVYRIVLPQPLKTGFSYTLVVDAQTGTAFTDTLGREVDELRTTFQIAGEKEKPAPAPAPSKKKKRR
ncbi:hypothetical protein ACJ2CR_05945 [Myxococcus faecalis]|uniref:hypothetical protein n=1 Tax=Myxococcus faecalis TaxID=3115646 RepID=UPI0038D08671